MPFIEIKSYAWLCIIVFLAVTAVQIIIAIHELGHWIFCKIFNIDTPSFSIGVGKPLLSKKIGGTTFTLSAIPLGGYVEISGLGEIEQGEQKNAFKKDDRSFNNRPYYQKLLIMSGGIIFNFLLSFFLFFYLWQTGMPKSSLLYPEYSTPTIEKIIKESPAEKSGLKAGERITKFNETPINSTEELLRLIKINKNITVKLFLENREEPASVKLEEHPQNKQWGYLGAIYTPIQPEKINSWKIAFIKSLDLTKTIFIKNIEGLKNSFKQKNISQMDGPLIVFAQAAESLKKGFAHMLLFMGLISIGLAVLNLLPLPILDGGQIATCTIEALLGRSLPEKIRYNLHLINAVVFIVFIILVSFKDSIHILKTYIIK